MVASYLHQAGACLRASCCETLNVHEVQQYKQLCWHRPVEVVLTQPDPRQSPCKPVRDGAEHRAAQRNERLHLCASAEIVRQHVGQLVCAHIDDLLAWS
jgi:hypothetical protein